MPTETTSEIRFLGRQLTRNELALIREVVTTCGGLSRMELANTVCELLGLDTPSGIALSRGEKRTAQRMATVAAIYTNRTPRPTARRDRVRVLAPRHEREEASRPRPENKRVWASLEEDARGRDQGGHPGSPRSPLP